MENQIGISRKDKERILVPEEESETERRKKDRDREAEHVWKKDGEIDESLERDDDREREPETHQNETSLPDAQPLPEIDNEHARLIGEASELLKNPRSLDNSTFRGREISAQQNETLDLIVQVKKHFERDRTALNRLKKAGIELKGLSTKNIGKKGIGPLKGYEVVGRTRESFVLLKGRSLYIYQLRLLQLQPPATGLNVGDRVNLIWPHSMDRPSVSVCAQELRRDHARSMSLLPPTSEGSAK